MSIGVSRAKLHRRIYITLLCLTGIAMTTSAFFSNLFWFLLLVNWLAEGRWKEKAAMLKESRMLQAFIALYAVYALWTLAGGDWGYALNDLRTKFPLIVLPVVTLTTPALTLREQRLAKSLFIASVYVVTIIGYVRYLTINDLPYRNIVPYISHIRFALCLCLTIALLTGIIVRQWQRHTGRQFAEALLITLLCVGLMAWSFYFLTLIQSYTAFVALTCMAAAGVALLLRSDHAASTKIVLTAIAVAALAAIGIVLKTMVDDYYRPTPLETQPLATATANGNAYSHSNDGIIENGGQINNYVCENELRSAWPKVSDMGIDELTPNGYAVYPTLVRYLGSKGLTKDSAGVAQLTADDVEAIAHGTANHVYRDGSRMRQMVYRTLFEYEMARVNGSIDNSSLGDRITLWKAGWHVFLQHPIAGVGTGNAVGATRQRLSEIGSPLEERNMALHNQYLTFLVSFGMIGFLLIGLAFARAAADAWRRMSITEEALIYILIILLSFLSENTLGTLAGILFCTWPIVIMRRPRDDARP